MNIRVTGEAASPHDALIRSRPRAQGLPRLQVVRVQKIRMTLLTQEGNRRDQQRVLIRAMRRVAIEAVLANGRMLEQERSALLRMALVAGLVDRIGLEQRIGQGAMRIMAVIAAHLPFGQRHVRSAIELRPDILMTLGAGLVDR